MRNDTSDTNDVKISPRTRPSGLADCVARPRCRPQLPKSDAGEARSPSERSRTLTWIRSLSRTREGPTAGVATGQREPAVDRACGESRP